MKNKSLVRLVFIFILISSKIIAQEKMDNMLKRNTLFAELVGSSATDYSIHYDRVFKTTSKSIFTYSFGIGFTPSYRYDLNPSYSFPLSINWLTGLKNHHFEMGIGLTYNSGVMQENTGYKKYDSFEALWASFRIGYRYQRPAGGLFLRAGFTPMLRLKRFSAWDDNNWYDRFLPLFGVGVGYTF